MTTVAVGFDPGFAALLADKRLTQTAKNIAAALAGTWARFKTWCWPSNGTIAKAVGLADAISAQRALRLLERCGYIRREADPANPTGRRIILVWKLTPSVGASASTGEAAAPTERGSSIHQVELEVNVDPDACARAQNIQELQGIADAPLAPLTLVAPPVTPQDPVATLKRASTLAGDSAGVDRLSAQLYGWLGCKPDTRGDFLGRLRRAVLDVADGRAPVGRLVACYQRAIDAYWARNKGAVFAKWWARGLGDTTPPAHAAPSAGPTAADLRAERAARDAAAEAVPPPSVEELHADLERARELARRFGGRFNHTVRELEAQYAQRTCQSGEELARLNPIIDISGPAPRQAGPHSGPLAMALDAIMSRMPGAAPTCKTG